MANSVFSLAGAPEVVWQIVGWGLTIVLGVRWSWILIASWRRAKAQKILHDWSSENHTPNLSRRDASSLAPEPAAKLNSAILSRSRNRRSS